MDKTVLEQLNPIKDVEILDIDCCTPFRCECCSSYDVHIGLIAFNELYVEIPITCNSCGQEYVHNYQNTNSL